MKKISELVDLRNQTKDIDIEKMIAQFGESLSVVDACLKKTSVNFDIDSNPLTNTLIDVLKKSNEAKHHYKNYVSELTNYIKKNDGELRSQNEEISRESNNNSDNNILEKIKSREHTHQPETVEYFFERCKLYSDWKYPGMQIRPGVGTWTKNLVDLDPLYLVDIDQNLLSPVKKIFNENYKNRLRFYTINDVDKPIFGQFPKNQFGFVLVTEFFNQKSPNTIKRYLTEIKELLRPGGVCIFTFNNCDYIEGVRNAENGYDTYTPGGEIANLCKSLGYELLENFSYGGTLSWIEIKNPGNLSSLRGGQTLAKILTR